MDAVALKRTLVRWEVGETAIILSASVLLPFVFHLIPPLAGLPLGARLLPMFYAPFIAVVLFRPHVAMVSGLLAPFFNYLITGHPLPGMIPVLTVELVVFCLLSRFIWQRWAHFRVAAPLAYLVSLATAALFLGSLKFFLSTLLLALPGLAALTLVNIALLRFQSGSR